MKLLAGVAALLELGAVVMGQKLGIKKALKTVVTGVRYESRSRDSRCTPALL